MFSHSSLFAIHCTVLKNYDCLSQRALGCFRIALGDYIYGVPDADATPLDLAYQEVQHRLARRGQHRSPLPPEYPAAEIAASYRQAFYTEEPRADYCGISLADFMHSFRYESNLIIHSGSLDEAFDDGSYILHFDYPGKVRLIGFQSADDAPFAPHSLRDVTIDADEFYAVLQAFQNWFDDQWNDATKEPVRPATDAAPTAANPKEPRTK